MRFDKNKILEIYNVNSDGIIHDQYEAINNTVQDFCRRNATKSSFYLKAHINLYTKYLTEKLRILIDAIFEQIGDLNSISKEDASEIKTFIEDFINRESKDKQNSLKSVMASVGMDQVGITSILLSKLESAFIHISSKTLTRVKLSVEKHNKKINEYKKNHSFLQRNSGPITAMASVTAVVISLIVTLITVFPIIQTVTGYLNNLPIITKYELNENMVGNERTIKIEWEISNVDSVIITPGIGKVSSSGTKFIKKNSTTSFTISAYLENKVVLIKKTSAI